MTPPDPSTYQFVLRRIPDWDPWLSETVSGYDEAIESKDIVHPDGARKRTVFINSEPFRDRLLRLGWEDVTALWARPEVEEAASPSLAGERAPRGKGSILRVQG